MSEDPQRPPTPEEEAKARRAIYILYTVMFVFITAPFVVWWFIK